MRPASRPSPSPASAASSGPRSATASPKYMPSDYGNALALAVTLFLGGTSANLLHPGYWQRMWAAKTDRVAQLAPAPLIDHVGDDGAAHRAARMGRLLAPAVDDARASRAGLHLALGAWLVCYFGWPWLQGVTLFVGISMVAGTCDKLQSGMIALFFPLAERLFGAADGAASTKQAFVVALMVLLNLPPILLALSGQSILELLLAQLLASSIVPPIFLGF